MKRLAQIAAVAATVALASCGRQDGFPQGAWIDLTHPFNADSVYWPTADTFVLRQDAHGHTEAGYFYTANTFSAAEHGGTHLDAPLHFAQGRWSAAEVPVDSLIGPGVVVDVAAKGTADRDYQVTDADFEAWEAQHGPMPQGAIVLIDTGSAQYYPDRDKYMGTSERGAGAVAKLHFPGIHPSGAHWLVKRGIRAVGLDTPSIDYGQSKLFESHRILYEENISGFENITNLGKLPARGFQVIALPMKIAMGSGAPLRIVAFVAD